MAYTLVAAMLSLDNQGENYYTKPVSMEGANAVQIQVGAIANSITGTAVLEAWPQVSPDLENWSYPLSGNLSGTPPATALISFISGEVGVKSALVSKSAPAGYYSTNIGAAWLRVAMRRSAAPAGGKSIVGVAINTYSE